MFSLLTAAGSMSGINDMSVGMIILNWFVCLGIGLVTAVVILGIPIGLGKLFFQKRVKKDA